MQRLLNSVISIICSPVLLSSVAQYDHNYYNDNNDQ